MKIPTPRLRLERLEARDLPAVFGIPWLDGSNLTLSFAPDGTAVSGDVSSLSAALSALGGDSARLEILRAYQTWAERANVNIGLVADSGAAFAANGSIQGDPRFGDIRLFGRALPGSQLAETSPFNVLGGTNAGDVTLNTSAPITIGGAAGAFDLFSVMLQESGHSLGIGNSDDPNSPMYEVYSGPRAGLTAGDVASIQSLYGARTPDRYEGLLGNDTALTATLFGSTLDADLTTRQDVDCYRFVATGSTARVSLQAAGHSLLTGRLSVLNSSGQVIASVTAADALHNDLTLNLSNLRYLGTYVIRVDSPRADAFSVGSYRLNYTAASGLTSFLASTALNVVNGSASGPLDTPTVQNYGDDRGSNDSIGKATVVAQPLLYVGPQYDANIRAVISTGADVDYYKIAAPLLGTLANAGEQMVMVATVWGLNGSTVDPRLSVFDQDQNPVAARVLTNNGGSFTIQVDHPIAQQTYYLRVASDGATSGNYEVAVDFRNEAVLLDAVAAGTLNSAAPQSTPTYLTCQSQLFHFVLGAGAAVPGNQTVRLEIYGAGHTLIYSLEARAGDTVSDDVFLQSGTYEIRFVSDDPSDGLDYKFFLAGLTDPVVSSSNTVQAPAGSDSGSNASGGTTSSSGSQYSTSSCPPPSDSGWY